MQSRCSQRLLVGVYKHRPQLLSPVLVGRKAFINTSSSVDSDRSTTFANNASLFSSSDKRQMSTIELAGKEQFAIENFNNGKMAYGEMGTLEILRAIVVFKICGIRILVKNSRALVNFSYTLLGEKLTNYFLKKTFFGHFCGGETQLDIREKINTLQGAGIGSILDYAAESEPNEEHDLESYNQQDMDHVSQDEVSARTYTYQDEAHCDENMKTTMYAIDAAASQGNDDQSFAAVKITSLGKPNFLEHVSKLLNESKTTFGRLAGIKSCDRLKYAEGNLSLEQLKKGVKESGIIMTDQEVGEFFKRADTDNNGQVDFIEWMTLLDSKSLSLGEVDNFRVTRKLNKQDIKRYEAMLNRLDTLCQRASESNVRLLIDAEQSYLQPAIDHLVNEMQKKYNTERAVVYNTIQCYTLISHNKCQVELERSRRIGFKYGVKLVRGAYMIQERLRSRQLNEGDPIQPNLEATHECYNRIVNFLLDNNDHASFMIASHNEVTVLKAIEKMNRLKLRPGSVCFAQLLGMSDHISFTLGQKNVPVFKYVPYGPIHEVLPYLIRRAEENSDLLGSTSKEIDMMKREIKRRIFGKKRE